MLATRTRSGWSLLMAAISVVQYGTLLRLRSSMFSKPRSPERSSFQAAKRGETSRISIVPGVMVFVTAPAQPSRNARRICSPEAVGGPEASRNGFSNVSGPTVASREG
ncbi:MAG: hypothetical protein BWX50_00185 [Euryarchaeota archaeon ADurb.Bin009]|nr:MAG: hypothetical protein BWX50_00185 [Euryarchaeota archaeon ADurb.Bin009]